LIQICFFQLSHFLQQ